MRSIGAARLVVMGMVAVILAGFFIFLMTRLSAQPMALLYSDLSTSDAGAVGSKLDSLKIPFEVNPEGTMIKVPADEVGRARMALAQDGLPSGGSLGYHEIFDQSQSFGTTSFMENLNQVRALEGELSRTVSSLAPVKSARIHLVMPKRELFSHDQQQATASVVLSLRPGAQLSREQISAVQHLIASAVPQLKPGMVSIVDDHGNLLARPDDNDSDSTQAASDDELRHAYETRLQHEVETLVGRTVGDGKVRATVTADMDFDKISTSQETFDPDQQVVRSTQTVDEKNDSQDATKEGGVSVANNLPASAAGGGGSGNSSTTKGSRSEETTNYEIGKTTRSQVRQGGQVKKLSIAVLVDGIETTDADGKQTYTPRDQAQMDQISALVKSATGYDAKRGDTITVSNMPFAVGPAEGAVAPETTVMGFERSDIVHLAETGVLGIVALLVVLLVVRPIINRLGAGNGDGTPSSLSLPAGSPQAALAGPSTGGTSMEALEQATAAAYLESVEDEDTMINLSRVEGRVKASSLRKIGEIVEKHPSEAVSIIRGWMYQES
jgi:flagellar M-ring protein FliF